MTPTTVNAWITDNAAKMKAILSIHSTFDEDAFQDAYLILVKEYPLPEVDGVLERAFLNAYKQCSGKAISEAFSLLHPDELFFNLLPAEETEQENSDETDEMPLAKKVQRHIRTTFPKAEVMAFEMRIKGFSYRDIAETIGIEVAAINKLTERIIRYTRRRFVTVTI